MSENFKCRDCGEQKLIGDMYHFKGKMKEQCRDCNSKARSASRAGGKKKGGGVAKVKREKKPAKEKRAAKTEAPLQLDIASGYGLIASLNGEGYLSVAQYNSAGEVVELLVSEHELTQLWEKFGPWAAKVSAAA